MNQASTLHAQPSGWQIDRFAVGVAMVGLMVLAALIWMETAAYLVVLFGVGTLLGIALYHGAFGFTAGWRNLVTQKRGAGLRAQLLLFALSSVIMVPMLHSGMEGLVGAVAPVGVSLLVGAFIFGIGMQLGGGCGSGTLFTVGSGNIRMVVTLLFFIIGSVIGTIHLPWWLERPGISPVSLVDSLSLPGAIVFQLILLGAIGLWVNRVERRAHGRVEWHELRLGGNEKGLLKTLLTGRWPFLWAIAALALGNVLTLAIAGSPWGITFAFGLWGAKVLQGMGVDMSQFEFWTWDTPALALADSVLVDTTSVMNFGLLLGAMLAAGMANRFNEASLRKPQGRQFLAAIVGGLLLGYGARLGFGCNIGALFSGIASASLHGWVWFASAFLGSLIGIRLRPWFRLPN